MKKALPYIATAIMLGIIIMLAPLSLVPSLVRYMATPESCAAQSAENVKNVLESMGLREIDAEKIDARAMATFPSSLPYVGTIIALGFFFALGVSLYFKRRMIQHHS